MSLVLTLDGVVFSVEVEGKKVIVNGKEYNVEEKEGTLEVNGTPYSVEVKEGEVLVNGVSRIFALKSEAHKLEKKSTSEEGAVTAIMPGRVINVLVKEGDSVKTGDVVCILEAMKMENELRAPRDGKVKKVLAQAGSNVEKGEVLVEIA